MGANGNTIEISSEEALALLEEGIGIYGIVRSSGEKIDRSELEHMFELSTLVTGTLGVTKIREQYIDTEQRIFHYEKKFEYESLGVNERPFEATFHLKAEFPVESTGNQWSVSKTQTGEPLTYIYDVESIGTL